MTSPVELIQQWLGCDEEAGRRLWFQPEILPDAAIFDVCRGKAMKEGWSWVARGLQIEPCDLESDATGAILAVHDRLKRGGQLGEEDQQPLVPPPGEEQGRRCSPQPDMPAGQEPQPARRGGAGVRYAFPSVGEFLAFLNISVRFAMHDILHKRVRDLRGDPPPDPPRPPEEPPYEPIRPAEVGGGEPVSLRPGPVMELMRAKRREYATRLVRDFGQTLDRKGVLQEHLDGLVTAFKEGREVPDEAVTEEVVEFLENKGKHHCHITRWFIERGIQEDNYFQRNRRLRKEWRAFRDGPGKADYSAYRELMS